MLSPCIRCSLLSLLYDLGLYDVHIEISVAVLKHWYISEISDSG
jgi:hypothetical protein